MRKTLGSICYLLGGAAGVLVLQLLIRCELLSAFSKVENQRYDFWTFITVTDGHHLAYPSGYFVHRRRYIGGPWKTVVYHRYPKLSVVCDIQTHFVLAANESRGPKPDVANFRLSWLQRSRGWG